MSIVNPLMPPDDKFRIWLIDEIFVGPSGPPKAKYVPNVNDRVEDWNSGLVYRVTAVDLNTGLSTLQIWNAPSIPDSDDRFIGSLPHYIYSVFMLYINTSVMPHTCAVDNRVRIFSTEATKCKVFRGTDLSENGEVISRRYNEVNVFIGEDIPLIPVVVSMTPLTTVKVPDTFYTNVSDLLDGADCTLVAYNDEDTVVAIARLVVVNTNFIREIDSAKKHITNIYLESPFMMMLSNDILQIPSNVLINDVQKFGVVVYSNGDKLKLPVDGVKFDLGGMNDFIPTIPGARIPLSLIYKLASNEVNNLILNSVGNTIVKDMWAEVLSPDGAYGVKLFVVPIWQDATSDYRLEYYLYTLDRDVFYHVTSLVEYNNDSPAFVPNLYGAAQTLGVSIDLSSINATFNAYRHVQTFVVSLKAMGDSLDLNQTRWEITYENGQTPKAGAGWFARKLYDNGVTGFDVDISCDATNPQEWLNKLYWPSKPIYNLATEGPSNIAATHFRIRTSLGTIADYDVAVANEAARFALTTATVTNGKVIKQMDNGRLYVVIDQTQLNNINGYNDQTSSIIKPIADALNLQVIKLAGMSDGEVVFIDFLKQVNTTFLEMGTVGLPIVTQIVP